MAFPDDLILRFHNTSLRCCSNPTEQAGLGPSLPGGDVVNEVRKSTEPGGLFREMIERYFLKSA